MATKFLEGLAEDQKDIKKIKTTLEKIYDIEVKQEKRESTEQKREKQKERRSKGDKKLTIEKALGIKKKDKDKTKKGLLGMLGGVFKGILGLGGAKLLALAGIGLVGATVTAYIKSEKFRNAVNEHVLIPMGKYIMENLPSLLMSAVTGAAAGLKITGQPSAASNPQQESSGTKNVREAEESVEKFFGRQKISEKTREARSIRQSMRYQDMHYGNALFMPGGNDQVERELQDFYKKGQTEIDKHLTLLSQLDNMEGQLQKLYRLMHQHDGNSPTYKIYMKEIVALQKNISIKERQVEAGELNLEKLAKEEKNLKDNEKKAYGEGHTPHSSAFAGTEFVKRQTGGHVLLAAKEFKKKRPGNGPLSEDTIAQGVQPIKRQRGGKVFLHWAASGYSGAHPNYHATIQGDGSVSKTRDYNTFGGAHTYGYNSQGIGISLAAMHGASPNNFGSYPVKPIQYENMAKLTASILNDWGHDASYVNDKTVATHAEAGRDNPGDNYGPRAWGGDGNKWDLWKLYENDEVGTGGPKIRAMVKAFMGGDNNMDEITTEKGGGTNTNTGAGTVITQQQQNEVQQTVSKTLNPIDMIRGLGGTLGKIGGPMGEFVEGALGKVADSFGGVLVAKRQKGGAVGKAVAHIKKDEALSSLSKGPYPNGKSDWIRPGGNSVISKTPWSKVNKGTPVHAYVDGVGVPTIGWGSTYYDDISAGTKKVKRGDKITKGKADSIMYSNVNKLAMKYKNKIPHWNKMSATQRAGLISMGYNAPNFYGAYPKITNALNSGDMKAVKANLTWGGPSATRIREAQQMMTQGPQDLKKASARFGPAKRVKRQDGGLVGMSENYHLNNVMGGFSNTPILVPYETNSTAVGSMSTGGGGVGYSGGGSSSNDSYRISMGAAYS